MATIEIALWAPVAALMAAHVAARAQESGATLTLPSLARRVPPSPAPQERG